MTRASPIWDNFPTYQWFLCLQISIAQSLTSHEAKPLRALTNLDWAAIPTVKKLQYVTKDENHKTHLGLYPRISTCIGHFRFFLLHGPHSSHGPGLLRPPHARELPTLRSHPIWITPDNFHQQYCIFHTKEEIDTEIFSKTTLGLPRDCLDHG